MDIAPDLGAIEHRRIEAGGLDFHAVVAGPLGGRPVILLHGFPEFWYGWRHQIGALAKAGFRVVVPDQRGYNLTDKPPRISDYRVDRLAADVAGIADALGFDSFGVVGHDWGGIVAWRTALQYPERVSRLAVLNAPHPSVMPRYAMTHPTQALRSWYMMFFQLPGVPEALNRADDFAAMRKALVGSSRPGTFSDDDFKRYREAWSQPGALTAMIHWYRALRYRPPEVDPQVRPATLVLWGVRDQFLEKGLVDRSLARCDHGDRILFPQATHWVQHEEAPAVNEALIGFLA